MPIHDQSYRRYAGTRAALGRSWTVIAWAGIRNMMAKRLFLVLLFAAWIPFIYYSIRAYLAANFSQFSMIALTSATYREFLGVQDVFMFFITIWAGAGLIANDRRANALQIYLSKPLMRAEYIAGKAAILVTFLLLITFVPSMMLLFLQVMFSGSFAFVKDNLFLFPAIAIGSLLQSLTATLTILALSSLSNSSRFVAILFAGIIFFTKAIYGVMYAITGNSGWAWMSATDNLAQVLDVVFRVPPQCATCMPRFAMPWTVSLLVVLGLMALSVSILERRVRGVEVVT